MISVVVCTRDRAESLRRTLLSLHAMTTPPGLAWEVVVVDNGSRDDTRAVAEATARTTGLALRYVPEPEPGLSRARNAGVRAARGELIAFTDDDCRVDPGWLAAIDAEFGADAGLAVLGGRVELNDPRDRPVAVRPHRERVEVSSLAGIATFMIGCNMTCRRRLFDEIGFFDVRLGAGSRIPAAEDWDWLYRARRRGARMLYVPEVLVLHDHGRKSQAEVEASQHAYAIGRWAFFCKHLSVTRPEVLRAAAHELRWLLESLVRGRRRPRALVPVALGVIFWLRAVLQRPREP
jgi:glycosyltransferase involved in cell wall biosynthesis